MQVEDELNTMFSILGPKKKGEVFGRLLDSNEFLSIWREFDKNTKDAFIERFVRTKDVEGLITNLPVTEANAQIIHDECVKAIEYVNSPHTPPVRSRVGTPVGSNNENESNSNNGSSTGAMSSRKRKSRKAKSRKAKSRKARKSRKSLRRHLD